MVDHFKSIGRWSKTDNKSLDGKLTLRRYFLDRYHVGEGRPRPRVLDCCQAKAVIWTALRREYDVQYWGVDRTPERGRLTIDSVRLLAHSVLPFDLIDVDTYGSPWRHYETLLPNLVRPTTVFLTLGKKGPAFATVDRSVQLALGLSRLERQPPQSLLWKLDEESVAACLARSYLYGVQVVDAQEVIPRAKNARYFGLHLIPPARVNEHENSSNRRRKRLRS